jgi:hypothetical protein
LPYYFWIKFLQLTYTSNSQDMLQVVFACCLWCIAMLSFLYKLIFWRILWKMTTSKQRPLLRGPKADYCTRVGLYFNYSKTYMSYKPVHETSLTPPPPPPKIRNRKFFFNLINNYKSLSYILKPLNPKIILLGVAVLFHSTWKLPKQFLL